MNVFFPSWAAQKQPLKISLKSEYLRKAKEMCWGRVGKEIRLGFVSRTLLQASTEEGVGALNSHSFQVWF